jgi:hypothetical protein
MQQGSETRRHQRMHHARPAVNGHRPVGLNGSTGVFTDKSKLIAIGIIEVHLPITPGLVGWREESQRHAR